MRIRMHPSGEADYGYFNLRVRLSAPSESVVEVRTYFPRDVRLHETDIFTSRDAFDDLIDRDGWPYKFKDEIVLLKLGIALVGFEGENPAERAVTAFARGRWLSTDVRLEEFVR
jgi:hypothetical protein